MAKQPRKVRVPVGPEDGERVLTICLRKLKVLSPEWQRFVLKTLAAYGEIGFEKQKMLIQEV